MVKISVIIISKNEEKKIGNALKSVSWADEIVIVDSGSTDGTADTARQYGAKVFFREFDDFSSQKNFAISKCSNDWILSIDCDEVVSENLQMAIKKAVESPDKFPGFCVRRVNYLFGKKLTHAAGDDFPARLFDRRKAVFTQPIHEHLTFKEEPGIIDGELLHYTTSDIKLQFDKTERYTELEARWLLERKKRPALFKLLFYPVAVFLNIFIIKKGFLDGYAGLLYAYVSARYAYIKYRKARILTKRISPKP